MHGSIITHSIQSFIHSVVNGKSHLAMVIDIAKKVIYEYSEQHNSIKAP